MTYLLTYGRPTDHRSLVPQITHRSRGPLGKHSMFYDFDYQAQLARPNLDTVLQHIYREQPELIVVFLCAAYAEKQWCGLEWRAVRDIIKSKRDQCVMFVRFDDAPSTPEPNDYICGRNL